MRKENKDLVMTERTIGAVIADKKSIEVNTIKLTGCLSDLEKDDIKELVEFLAETNPAWNDVLFNKRIAVLFDVESGEKIKFNVN